MDRIDWLGVAIATFVGFFLLGGLWYSRKVFGMRWGRAAGFVDAQGNLLKPKTPGTTSEKHPASVFATSFVLAGIAAVLFAWTLPAAYTLKDALVHGLVIGAGFVATSLGINYQFAARGNVLWAIDGGYHLFQFVIYGLVFGLLHGA
jgi:hypothetical protein